MNFSTIRAIVQYNDERVGILFERCSSQKEFVEKCLEEFENNQKRRRRAKALKIIVRK